MGRGTHLKSVLKSLMHLWSFLEFDNEYKTFLMSSKFCDLEVSNGLSFWVLCRKDPDDLTAK